MLQEFKKFIMRGNVVDLAVAVIIGAAFGRIVASFVNDMLMPVLGMFVGFNFTDLKIVISEAQGDLAEIAVFYGSFIQAVLDFLIIGLAIFLMIKTMNRFQKKKEDAPPPAPLPTKEETLLTEIRDLIAGGQKIA